MKHQRCEKLKARCLLASAASPVPREGACLWRVHRPHTLDTQEASFSSPFSFPQNLLEGASLAPSRGAALSLMMMGSFSDFSLLALHVAIITSQQQSHRPWGSNPMTRRASPVSSLASAKLASAADTSNAGESRAHPPMCKASQGLLALCIGQRRVSQEKPRGAASTAHQSGEGFLEPVGPSPAPPPWK